MLDQFKGNQPPLKIFFSKSGGVDAGVQPPIQNSGGVETPNIPCLAPLVRAPILIVKSGYKIYFLCKNNAISKKNSFKIKF